MSVPKKCLIIDDEVGITFLTKKFPEIERYQTLTCSNGDDALTIIEENREEIELVVLNIMLHGLSGYEILEVIKYKYPKINVVLFLPPVTEYPWTKILQCKNCGKYTEHNLKEEHRTIWRGRYDPWFYECTICGIKRRLYEKRSEVEKLQEKLEKLEREKRIALERQAQEELLKQMKRQKIEALELKRQKLEEPKPENDKERTN